MATRSESPKPPTPKQEAASVNTSQSRLSELAKTSTELARAVAKNESADPDLLRELASNSDETTRSGVATNPNTPTDVLLKLGAQFPEQLLNNPVFSLLLLENSNFLADMPKLTLLSLLKRDVVPETFLEWAASNADKEVLLLVATNPNTPEHILELLAQGNDNDTIRIRLGLARNPNTPMSVLEQLAGAHCHLIRKRVAYHPKTPLTLQQQFQLQLEATQNSETSTDTLQELATSKWAHIRLGVAGHPNTPGDTLEQLARDRDLLVRMVVALNLNSPIGALEPLATDRDPWLRRAVATHPNTPTLLLIKLAEDCEPNGARVAVALNPNTPSTLLEELAKDKGFEEVCESLAQNPSTPVSILEQLERHPDSTVRDYARYNLGNRQEGNLLAVYRQGALSLRKLGSDLEVYRGIPESMRSTFASRRSDTDIDNEIATFLGDRISWLGQKATLNPYLREIILESLVGCATTNFYLPASILESLAEDEDVEVRSAVAANRNTPANTLQRLAGDQYFNGSYAPVRDRGSQEP